MFARPTSALWAAEKYHTPFLTVIYNNSRHQATVNNWNKHIPDNMGKRLNNYVGVDIDPSPDYAVLAQACRAYGETVEDPADVLPALEERARAGARRPGGRARRAHRTHGRTRRRRGRLAPDGPVGVSGLHAPVGEFSHEPR